MAILSGGIFVRVSHSWALAPIINHEKYWWHRFLTCAPAPVRYRCHQKLFGRELGAGAFSLKRVDAGNPAPIRETARPRIKVIVIIVEK
jgi:hypothetical protein